MTPGRLAFRLQAFLVLVQVPTVAMPVWWGVLADARGYTLVDYGVLVTSSLVGPALASLALAARIDRINRRLVIAGAMLVCAATFVGYALIASPRAVAALWGVTMATQSAAGYYLAQSYFAELPDMDRQLGIHVSLSMLLQAALLAVIPQVASAAGLVGLQAALGTGALAAAIMALSLPGPATTPSATATMGRVAAGASHRLPTTPAWLAIATFTAFYTYITEFYSYSERFGSALGLSGVVVGQVLGATTLVGLAGSLAVTALGDRFGRLWPLSIGSLLGLIAAVLVTAHSLGNLGYWVAMSVFSIVWSLMQPYATALLLAVDPSGRALMLSVPVRGLIGAGIAALVTALSARWGLDAVVWVSGLLLVTTPLFAWMTVKAQRAAGPAGRPAADSTP